MKITISGDKDYTNYQEFENFINKFTKNKVDVIIITGNKSGTESLAIQYGKNNGYIVRKIKETINREYELVKNTDLVLCFWDGVQSSTKRTIDESFYNKKTCKIYGYT